jgi:hypothetical protein
MSFTDNVFEFVAKRHRSPHLDEHQQERLRRALETETVAAQSARYQEMGHPDDGGAYMVRP